MFGLSGRSVMADVAYTENGVPVYRVGAYLVRIEEAVVTYVRERQPSTDPRRVLPNLAVEDGELRVPLEDLTQLILDRIPPAEVAKTLWQDEEVRSEFMYHLRERYTGGGLTTGDRKKFLHGVQETVHAEGLYRLVNVLQSLEHDFALKYELWDWAGRIAGHAVLTNIKECLENARARFGEDAHPAVHPIQRALECLQRHTDEAGRLELVATPMWSGSPVTRVGGEAWHEARDYWRARVEELFPGPVEPAPEAEPKEIWTS